MKKKHKKQELTKSETIDILAKSMCNMMKKAIQKNKKKKAKTVVEDVLDGNFEAEVDQDTLPPAKSGVLWKKDTNKKGVNKLKSFVKQKKK